MANPQSILVSAPGVNFDELISACVQSLSHSVTTEIEETFRKLTDAEKFLSILNHLKETEYLRLLDHVSFSVLTLAEYADMVDLMEVCSGMPVIQTESKMRGALVAIITGTLKQWREAVVIGSNHPEPSIRSGFCQIHDLFVQAGLHSVWNEYEHQMRDDGTYGLIEYQP